MDSNVYPDEIQSNGVFMFVDKETGACYKPASYKAPAKGIRFYIDFLADHPEVVDPYFDSTRICRGDYSSNRIRPMKDVFSDLEFLRPLTSTQQTFYLEKPMQYRITE